MSDERVNPVFTVTGRFGGYAHEKLVGTYTGDATKADVEKAFFGPFGGRDAHAANGCFTVIVHAD
jgi:hypothetical protein